jgi:hypothetical protein
MDWIQVAHVTVQKWGLMKKSNGNRGSIKGGEFLHQLRKYRLVKNDSTHEVS